MKEIIQNALINSLSFEEYLKRHSEQAERLKKTGFDSEDIASKYSLLNFSRTKRVAKKVSICEALTQKIKENHKDQIWLLITEPWCGDAAHTVPLIHKISEANEHINLRLVYRDENPELMQHFLTNGSAAIPILIFIDKHTLEVYGHWGPRPAAAQQKVTDYKSLENKPPYENLMEDLQKWYNGDKGLSAQSEIIATYTQLVDENQLQKSTSSAK